MCLNYGLLYMKVVTIEDFPKVMLFLELGIVPFREIIRKRKLGFLSHILKEDEESLFYRFIESQRRNKTPKDWVTTVLSDIKKLNIGMTFEDIKLMKKCTFMNLVKKN
jgi:hypothetical protein